MSKDGMDLKQISELCYDSINNAILWGNSRFAQITLVMDKKPEGFPRGELLQEDHRGKVYRFSSLRVLSWVLEACNKLGPQE